MRLLLRGITILSCLFILVLSSNFTIAHQDDPLEWLYFSGSPGLFRMLPDGSHLETLIDNLTIHGTVTWSADGQWLIFTGYDENIGLSTLYRFNVYDQRLAELMSSGGSPRFKSWSPDGEWLYVNDLYGDGLNYLMVMHPDGSDNHSPIPDISYSIFSGWSPDSQWILFDASHESSSDVYVVRPDGSGLQNLTQRAEADYGGRITPDGEWIIYNSEQNHDTDIFRMHWDGSEKQNLTDTPERYERLLTLSPNGEWAIFVSTINVAAEIYRMHIDGSDEMRLTDSNGTVQFRGWSPDGTWMYVEYGYDVESEILRIQIETGDVEQLTNDGVADFFQLLSSDGRWMIYTSGQPDGTGELRVMDVATGESTLLAAFPFWVEMGDFSPDGDWFYFTMPDEALTLQLYRVRLDGTDLEQLTASAGDKSFLTWSRRIDEP